MKWLKKLILCSLFIMPSFVNAGSISFNNPQKLSSDKYSFTLTIRDMDLNYLNGKLNITNGTISKITMANGWSNKTGTNNDFYFYRDGISKGEYLIATVEVTMTGNSEYSVSDLEYGAYKCQKDNYGNYFGENGEIVNATTFKNTCEKSKDASLKSLIPSVGELSPSFSSENYNYNLKVDSTVNTISFDAIPTDSKAKVIYGNKCTLTNSATACYIDVQADAGDKKTYTVFVYKEDCENNSIAISNFKVHNGVLDKTFDENETKYTVTPSENAEVIYFSFDLDGISYTSKECSSLSSTCSLTITNNGTKKKYVFTIFHEEETEENSKEESNTSNSEQSTSTNKPVKEESKETNTKEESSTKDEVEVSDEEETKDPIEQNKENEEDENTEESDIGKDLEIIKEDAAEKDKNKFFVILCLINVFLGICIGLFIKRKK